MHNNHDVTTIVKPICYYGFTYFVEDRVGQWRHIHLKFKPFLFPFGLWPMVIALGCRFERLPLRSLKSVNFAFLFNGNTNKC